jgi:trehalose 6-phosphate phosphatase
MTSAIRLHGRGFERRRGFSKANGVRELMASPPILGRCPVFIGDNITDLDLFAVIAEFDGIGTNLGNSPPGVSFTFARPADVRHWLKRISCNEAIAAS